MNLFSLHDQVAIVTGGGNGLGKSEAIALAEAGAKTVVVDLNLRDARQTAEELKANGFDAIAIQADVTKQSDVDRIMRETIVRFKKIDILVNNAGINIRKPVLDFTISDWKTILHTNLISCYLCSKVACEYMIPEKSGKILNIASHTISVTIPGRAAYSSSKAGLVQLTKHLAVELAQYGIRVNAICPGPMATDMNLKMKENVAGVDKFIEEIPLKRIGRPVEIKGTVVYLASDASSYVTGTTIFVDGGWAAK